MGKQIVELHAMLKLHEKGISNKAETLVVLAIREGMIQKDKKIPRGAKGKDKGKTKLAYAPKPKIPPPPKRDNLTKDFIYHHYNEGLRESRKLKHGALSLYIGNAMRVEVEAIRSFDLILPSGLIIVLDNCHYAPAVTRGVVSISHLVKNGYTHTFTNYGISVSKDNVFYFNAIPRDGIYKIDMHNLYPNVSSINAWTMRWTLHIYVYEILQPTHDESLEKCKSCISGKMATHNLNMVPTKKAERTPYEMWHRKAPKLSYLRVWGCEALVKRDAPDKLDPRSVKSARIPQAPDRYGFYVDVKEHELVDLNEPPNYKVPLSDPEFEKWLEAVNTEMQSMKDNQVWIFVDLPPNGRTVRSKSIFKKKTDMDDKVQTFKAHLVAKGYTQIYDVDYGETFSPVADIRAIRILLAIAAYYDYKICKLLEVGIRDLGEEAYILGIKIIRNRFKWLIALSQSAYLEKTLNKFWMENSKKGYTPMIEKPGYSNSQGAKTPSEVQRMRRVPYASAIEIHWNAVKTILKYLRNTKDMVLVYGAKDEAKMKKSAKQSTTTMSSTEAEYIAAAEASMEAVSMRKFIDGLGGVMSSDKRPMEMLLIQEREIVLKKVHIDHNVVDPLTKPMPVNKHYEHARAIRIVPAIPSKEDLDNLFGPLYEEYYATSTREVSDDSATNTLNNEDTPSSSSIVVKEDDAPQIVTSSEVPIANEATTLVSNENANEKIQEHVPAFDENDFYNPFHSPVLEKVESSSTF
ncbi:retrotransposon protein, putative, ty1-copia subclass [Tanacetum coccineum]